MSGLGARELLDLVVDEGSWRSWDVPIQREPEDPAYRATLTRARARTGLDEAVLTGEGTIRGHRVAIMACEFGFLAGSIGVDAAERLTAAVERATRERLPLLASPASGGTRMQEGTHAFVQMVKVTAAICQHRAAGLPYLVYLRHPSTGGVLASWGSLGHVTVAEPGALVGFLGPRVYEALYDRPFPEGVQRAENLYDHGLVDAVLPAPALPDIVHRTLSILTAPCGDPVAETAAATPAATVDAWAAVTRSRDPRRPGARRLLRYGAVDVVPLNGTGQGERDPGLILALARFGAASCVLLAQDRRAQASLTPMGPGGLREARRGIRLADELGLPLVTVIDTPGAALSVEAEEGGLAGEIARCLADMVTLPAPTLTVLLGEGSGGGALALLPGDRVIAAQHAWLSPLPPEGASAILHRSAAAAPQMARGQGVAAADLLRNGIVDRVVPERPDAASEPEDFCRRLGAVIGEELRRLHAQDPVERLAARRKRLRTT
ncbi:MAG TPA: carboxyl transferase domain-containing protein [Segeticoccus sp.]|uniref:carboxyl transferase domain-containing protein n=1 Tax=Segeticoccus sp. TaxID=2706531 RepID=UPI002D7FA753|nr:carboxyl transferase domain-containing protein [Segeticoccus sp.]HET8598826.1 carboxyl transferase domain-containing protein [Segeticoccus sp.]